MLGRFGVITEKMLLFNCILRGAAFLKEEINTKEEFISMEVYITELSRVEKSSTPKNENLTGDFAKGMIKEQSEVKRVFLLNEIGGN